MVVLLYMYMLLKKIGKESQYIVSCPEPSSDLPIESNRESGRDSDPVWVNDMDPIWIITVIPFASYNTIQS